MWYFNRVDFIRIPISQGTRRYCLICQFLNIAKSKILLNIYRVFLKFFQSSISRTGDNKFARSV